MTTYLSKENINSQEAVIKDYMSQKLKKDYMCQELKKVADKLLYKNPNDKKLLLTPDFKKGYNQGIMDLADELSRKINN